MIHRDLLGSELYQRMVALLRDNKVAMWQVCSEGSHDWSHDWYPIAGGATPWPQAMHCSPSPLLLSGVAEE